MNTVITSSPRVATASRRRLLQAGAATAALGIIGAPSIVRAQGVKIRIGYWPIAAGLPFYAAIELGYFKEAGLDVEALKFAGAQQVMEAVLSGRAILVPSEPDQYNAIAPAAVRAPSAMGSSEDLANASIAATRFSGARCSKSIA